MKLVLSEIAHLKKRHARLLSLYSTGLENNNINTIDLMKDELNSTNENLHQNLNNGKNNQILIQSLGSVRYQ